MKSTDEVTSTSDEEINRCDDSYTVPLCDRQLSLATPTIFQLPMRWTLLAAFYEKRKSPTQPPCVITILSTIIPEIYSFLVFSWQISVFLRMQVK